MCNSLYQKQKYIIYLYFNYYNVGENMNDESKECEFRRYIIDDVYLGKTFKRFLKFIRFLPSSFYKDYPAMSAIYDVHDVYILLAKETDETVGLKISSVTFESNNLFVEWEKVKPEDSYFITVGKKTFMCDIIKVDLNGMGRCNIDCFEKGTKDEVL